MIYTITDYQNLKAGCQISHFDIVSNFSDLDKFQFCPSSVITTSNNTARLDATQALCLQFTFN